MRAVVRVFFRVPKNKENEIPGLVVVSGLDRMRPVVEKEEHKK
jgi:hypothetical protein